MSDRTAVVPINIADELTELSLLRYHPNKIIGRSLDRVSEMLGGDVEVIAPSNPFAYLLETSCLNTASAVMEMTLLTRKLYPRLANSEEDLYLHMSDADYIGRFCEPDASTIRFTILLSDIKTRGYFDDTLREWILKIPRHYNVKVDKYIYTIMAAIVIRVTEAGVIDVRYESTENDGDFDLDTTYIPFELTTSGQLEQYIVFDVVAKELDIEMIEIPVEASKLFKDTLSFNDARKFYKFRAFHYAGGAWHEMLVTHTDEVYDINTPTCVIKVMQKDHELEYYIPPVYINTGKVTNKVKFLLYTSNGKISVNFGEYKVEEFTSGYTEVFRAQDLDDYTSALALITKYVYMLGVGSGGKDAISFEDLKASVIDNSIGDRQLPITNKQLEYAANQLNFELIRDVDLVTNRKFLLVSDIPESDSLYHTPKINMGMCLMAATFAELVAGNHIEVIHSKALVMQSGALFKVNEKNTIDLVEASAHDALAAKSGLEFTQAVNGSDYLSSIYHNVIDIVDDELELRAYDLSTPSVLSTSYEQYNRTSGVDVSNVGASFNLTPNGYSLDLAALIKKYDDTINDTNLTPHLIYVDADSGAKYYIQGRLYSHLSGVPVYRFDLESKRYIDRDNKIHVTNFKDVNGALASIPLSLEAALTVVWSCNQVVAGYTRSTMDDYLTNTYFYSPMSAVTRERYRLFFGYWLEHLLQDVRSSTGEVQYAHYTEDVIARYTRNVYNAQNQIVHTAGEIILDEEGNPTVAARAGEVILDAQGNPQIASVEDVSHYFHILVEDYRAASATDTDTVAYRTKIRKHLTNKTVVTAQTVNDDLLENTQARLVVPKSTGTVTVDTPEGQRVINAAQGFALTFYVSEAVYSDSVLRESIESSAVEIIADYLANHSTLVKTELLNKLYTQLSSVVATVVIDKFTELGSEYIGLVDKSARVGLKSTLNYTQNVYTHEEDVLVSFKSHKGTVS